MEISTDLEKRTIVGRAINYNKMSKPIRDSANGPLYTEIIAPGALKRSLETNKDILSFKDHNRGMLLGRTSSGTMKLRDTDAGLEIELNVPDTTYGNDLLEQVKRGDVTGFSFGFKPLKSRTYNRDNGKVVERTEIDLRSVDPVCEPAYDGTMMNLRSVEDTEWIADPINNFDSVALNISYRQKSNILKL